MIDYGGRRFLLVVGFGLINTALLVGGYIDQTVYAMLQGGTVAAYIAGNGAQKYVEKKYANGSSN